MKKKYLNIFWAFLAIVIILNEFTTGQTISQIKWGSWVLVPRGFFVGGMCCWWSASVGGPSALVLLLCEAGRHVGLCTFVGGPSDLVWCAGCGWASVSARCARLVWEGCGNRE